MGNFGNTAVEELGRSGVAFGGEEQPPYQCLNTRPSDYQVAVKISTTRSRQRYI